MTREELDKMWNIALRESAEAGETYTRYRFANLVIEKCARICDDYGMPDGTSETARILAKAIRAKGNK
jgi:hypothetical protein